MAEFILQNQWVIWLAIAWTIPWKGIALWKAARNSDKIWFVILLIFNTLAILEIIYIFVFSRRVKDAAEENKSNISRSNGTDFIQGL